MSERRFVIHTKDGNKVITESEAIKNAQEQEQEGITGHYSFYDYKNKEQITPPGWLVWSTHEDGCGVVYRRSDGKMILVTGWQGEFAYI